MDSGIRVEIPILHSSRILTTFETVGELKKAKEYEGLRFIRYIYLDPKDGKLKCENPINPPIVENAFITIAGTDKEKLYTFIKDATEC